MKFIITRNFIFVFKLFGSRAVPAASAMDYSNRNSITNQRDRYQLWFSQYFIIKSEFYNLSFFIFNLILYNMHNFTLCGIVDKYKCS